MTKIDRTLPKRILKRIRRELRTRSGKNEVAPRLPEKTSQPAPVAKKGVPAGINPITGLKERTHSFYKVPIVSQRSLGALKFNGQQTAVHSVPIGGGRTLDFFAKLGRSDEIIVTFMGANTKERNFYPRFSRVATFRARVPAFMSFADPTLTLDPSREMLLSWYLGGPDFDPSAAILRAIEKAKGKTGAKHVVFVGGSGGGFPALRLSAMLPGSLAYLHEGTTDINKSIPVSVARYFSKIWPGHDQEKLLAEMPERFNMVKHYEDTNPQNFVYFVQSEDDKRFREDHYDPFKKAMGITRDVGETEDGRRKFVLYKGKVKGHGQVTAVEFDFHFNNALAHWRERR